MPNGDASCWGRVDGRQAAAARGSAPVPRQGSVEHPGPRAQPAFDSGDCIRALDAWISLRLKVRKELMCHTIALGFLRLLILKNQTDSYGSGQIKTTISRDFLLTKKPRLTENVMQCQKSPMNRGIVSGKGR